MTLPISLRNDDFSSDFFTAIRRVFKFSFSFLYFSIHSYIFFLSYCLSVNYMMYRGLFLIIFYTWFVDFGSFMTSFRVVQISSPRERRLGLLGVYDFETVCFCLWNKLFPSAKQVVFFTYTSEKLLYNQLIKSYFAF